MSDSIKLEQCLSELKNIKKKYKKNNNNDKFIFSKSNILKILGKNNKMFQVNKNFKKQIYLFMRGFNIVCSYIYFSKYRDKFKFSEKFINNLPISFPTKRINLNNKKIYDEFYSYYDKYFDEKLKEIKYKKVLLKLLYFYTEDSKNNIFSNHYETFKKIIEKSTIDSIISNKHKALIDIFNKYKDDNMCMDYFSIIIEKTYHNFVNLFLYNICYINDFYFDSKAKKYIVLAFMIFTLFIIPLLFFIFLLIINIKEFVFLISTLIFTLLYFFSLKFAPKIILFNIDNSIVISSKLEKYSFFDVYCDTYTAIFISICILFGGLENSSKSIIYINVLIGLLIFGLFINYLARILSLIKKNCFSQKNLIKNHIFKILKNAVLISSFISSILSSIIMFCFSIILNNNIQISDGLAIGISFISISLIILILVENLSNRNIFSKIWYVYYKIKNNIFNWIKYSLLTMNILINASILGILNISLKLINSNWFDLLKALISFLILFLITILSVKAIVNICKDIGDY